MYEVVVSSFNLVLQTKLIRGLFTYTLLLYWTVLLLNAEAAFSSYKNSQGFLYFVKGLVKHL